MTSYAKKQHYANAELREVTFENLILQLEQFCNLKWEIEDLQEQCKWFLHASLSSKIEPEEIRSYFRVHEALSELLDLSYAIDDALWKKKLQLDKLAPRAKGNLRHKIYTATKLTILHLTETEIIDITSFYGDLFFWAELNEWQQMLSLMLKYACINETLNDELNEPVEILLMQTLLEKMIEATYLVNATPKTLVKALLLTGDAPEEDL